MVCWHVLARCAPLLRVVTSCVLCSSIGVTHTLSDSALISIPHCALSLRLHSAHALRQRVLLIYVRAFAPRSPPPTCATALVSR